ncbi:uncharacterized protein LOC142318153 [Lycorma delicatula]|uniref:uncharacterized protein LOC142318153 n=1 Tax=Lycorma delicatula TaxID=130591 RepID=UPI003F50DE32
MDEDKKFENICRICTDESEGINIFSEEGKKYNLEGKIRKYLYISVYIEDKLPKMVCSDCTKKLDNVHQFATMAVKMQEKLKNYLKTKSEEMLNETQEDHEGSLLHSILTKSQNSAATSGSISTTTSITTTTTTTTTSTYSNGNISPPSEVTEVEVRVDPMLFFCDDVSDDADHSASAEVSSETQNEEKLQNNKEKPKTEISNKPTFSTVHQPHQLKETKPYQCTVPSCPRGFNTEIGLQNHLWGHSALARKVLTTSDLNTRRCSTRKLSSLAANNTSEPDSPADNSDTPTQNYMCPMCGKKISTKGNLKVHLETHRPKGKYGCDICGRIFKTQSNLYRHKEYHGGVQYPCQICGRVYPTNSTLRAHSITHSNLRPHKCPLCDKTFKRNQDLKFHINQHTGARPYQCPYCPKAFASSGNCFSHRKRMHPSEVERDREMADEII